MLGCNLMSQISVLLLFSVLSAKTTKIILIVFVSVVLGMERKFFDQSHMQDLPFMNTIEHIGYAHPVKSMVVRKRRSCAGQGLCVESMVNPRWRMLEVALIRVYLH